VKTFNKRFIDFADWVSAAMGSPINIIFWVILVAAWFVLFAINPALQKSSFLPSWFTSNAFNFPLNSITTLAELYIGFLIAAAANRVERHNRVIQEQQMHIIEHINQTNDHEEQELRGTEQRLLAQDQTMLTLLERIDRQDAELARQTTLLMQLAQQQNADIRA
jgi:hypothetical protein